MADLPPRAGSGPRARRPARLISFFPDVRVREVGLEEVRVVDPGLKAFDNLNTPEELEPARRELARR